MPGLSKDNGSESLSSGDVVEWPQAYGAHLRQSNWEGAAPDASGRVREDIMASKQLVLAIFNSEADADAAAEDLKSWEQSSDGIKLKSVGVLALDENGKVKVDKVGRRSTGKGAGIGILLAMATPIGLAAGVIGGGLLGALHHKGLGISNDDRERIGAELAGGKAAVGVVSNSSQTEAILKELEELGGAPESYDLDDAAVAGWIPRPRPSRPTTPRRSRSRSRARRPADALDGSPGLGRATAVRSADHRHSLARRSARGAPPTDSVTMEGNRHGDPDSRPV